MNTVVPKKKLKHVSFVSLCLFHFSSCSQQSSSELAAIIAQTTAQEARLILDRKSINQRLSGLELALAQAQNQAERDLLKKEVAALDDAMIIALDHADTLQAQMKKNYCVILKQEKETKKDFDHLAKKLDKGSTRGKK